MYAKVSNFTTQTYRGVIPLVSTEMDRKAIEFLGGMILSEVSELNQTVSCDMEECQARLLNAFDNVSCESFDLLRYFEFKPVLKFLTSMNKELVKNLTSAIVNKVIQLLKTVCVDENDLSDTFNRLMEVDVKKVLNAPSNKYEVVSEQADAMVDIMYYILNGASKSNFDLNFGSFNDYFIDSFNEEIDDTLPNDVKQSNILSDIISIILYTGEKVGFRLNDVFEEVHNSNLSKRDPSTGKFIIREDGKVVKPDGWVAPNIFKVLFGDRCTSCGEPVTQDGIHTPVKATLFYLITPPGAPIKMRRLDGDSRISDLKFDSRTSPITPIRKIRINYFDEDVNPSSINISVSTPQLETPIQSRSSSPSEDDEDVLYGSSENLSDQPKKSLLTLYKDTINSFKTKLDCDCESCIKSRDDVLQNLDFDDLVNVVTIQDLVDRINDISNLTMENDNIADHSGNAVKSQKYSNVIEYINSTKDNFGNFTRVLYYVRSVFILIQELSVCLLATIMGIISSETFLEFIQLCENFNYIRPKFVDDLVKKFTSSSLFIFSGSDEKISDLLLDVKSSDADTKNNHFNSSIFDFLLVTDKSTKTNKKLTLLSTFNNLLDSLEDKDNATDSEVNKDTSLFVSSMDSSFGKETEDEDSTISRALHEYNLFRLKLKMECGVHEDSGPSKLHTEIKTVSEFIDDNQRLVFEDNTLKSYLDIFEVLNFEPMKSIESIASDNNIELPILSSFIINPGLTIAKLRARHSKISSLMYASNVFANFIDGNISFDGMMKNLTESGYFEGNILYNLHDLADSLNSSPKNLPLTKFIKTYMTKKLSNNEISSRERIMKSNLFDTINDNTEEVSLFPEDSSDDESYDDEPDNTYSNENEIAKSVNNFISKYFSGLSGSVERLIPDDK